jgi:plastocyanin
VVKKYFFAFVLALTICASAFGSVGVSVEDDFYSPANITVAKGTTVVWSWNGRSSHSVTSGTPSAPTTTFNSGIQSSGTFSFTFNQVGTFPYFCMVHGTMMEGSVNVTCSKTTQILQNPGFESGAVRWTQSASGIINKTTTFPPHAGSWKAQLNGKGTKNTQSIVQTISIPSGACSAKLSFFLRVASTETATVANDKLKVQILDNLGAVKKTVKTFSNLNKSGSYSKHTFNIAGFAGQTIKIRFLGTENSSLKTTFLVDDTAVTITQ